MICRLTLIVVALLCPFFIEATTNQYNKEHKFNSEEITSSEPYMSDTLSCLIKHAQWGNPKAFESLADLYRHGKEGLQKSMINTMVCYGFAQKDPGTVGNDIFESNPEDEFGLMMYLMDILSKQGVIALREKIQNLPPYDFSWLKVLSDISLLPDGDEDEYMWYVLNNIDEKTDTDAFVIAYSCLAILHSNYSKKDITIKLKDHADELPVMFNKIGEEYVEKYRRQNKGNPILLIKALENFQKADEKGFLKQDNAQWIVVNFKNHNKLIEKYFGENALQRLIRLSNLYEEGFGG